MKIYSILFLIIFLFDTDFFNQTSIISANELSGFVSIGDRYFFNDPMYPDQSRHNASSAFQWEYCNSWNNMYNISLNFFFRFDNADPKRTHYDVRELIFIWFYDFLEIRIGIGKVFWGATEFVHLVDIINQTDLVESIDNEAKLGQPLSQFTVSTAFGILKFFGLPYFRERTFAGSDGRLRYPLIIDVENPKYENSKEEKHFDFAFRYSYMFDNWDIGIYYFRGTNREPILTPNLNNNKNLVLIPYYTIINQIASDIQGVVHNWLFKLETLYRDSHGDEEYFSFTCGIEYTFFCIMNSSLNLGLVAEVAYDERGEKATTVYNNEAMFAFRFNFNDQNSTTILSGIAIDVKNYASVLSIEANRRIGNNIKILLEGKFFLRIPMEDLLYNFHEDDFLCLTISYYL